MLLSSNSLFSLTSMILGIHMPCKSVVIFGDSPFLNSIEYHQMSGRAGRRGFDTEGNVIFMGLSKKRHDMLMTDKLPKMLGNTYNYIFMIRIFIPLAFFFCDKLVTVKTTSLKDCNLSFR